MKFCNVAIPHSHLDELTYSFDPERLPGLAPGDCVRVRLRGRRVKALVLSLPERSPVSRTIPVDELVEPGMLDGRLLRLLEWVRSYYFGRMGETLSFALAPGVCGYGLRRDRTKVVFAREAPGSLPHGPEWAEPRFKVWVHTGVETREDVVARFLAAALHRGSGIVLAPEADVRSWAERLGTRLGVEPVLYPGSHKSRERRAVWRDLRNGERRLVLGVRSAVFAPVQDLAGIAVVDEHDRVFKEERRPAFHARDVAVLRARLEGCPMLLADPTPSAETWHNLKAGVYRELKLDHPVARGPADSIVVDMRRHRADVLSPLLAREVGRALASGAVVLYLNRKGLSRYIACNECGSAFVCPSCQVPMVLGAKSGLSCQYCARSGPAPESCPSCRGTDFRFRAPGLEMVAREVAAIAPDAVLTLITTETPGVLEPGPGRVYVGTRALLGKQWPDKVSLVAAVAVDSDLCRCDFRARERVFQTLASLERKAEERGARLIVQTRRPDEPAIRCALQRDASSFLDLEIEARMAAQFPPFRRVALLEFRSSDAAAAEAQAAKVARAITPARRAEVLGPVPAVPGRVGFRLLVKVPRDLRLDRLLARDRMEAPRVSVRVDVDPLDVA